MMLSHEERAALAAAMNEAWHGTTTTSTAVARLRALLLDGEQAHRKWAVLALDEALDRGCAQMLKRHRAASKPKVPTKKGDMPRVVGAQVRTEDGALEWRQPELIDLTREQIKGQVLIRGSQRKATDKVIAVMRRLDVLFDAHPTAGTVGEALALEGVSLDDWLAA